jgi:hypothetical protein
MCQKEMIFPYYRQTTARKVTFTPLMPPLIEEFVNVKLRIVLRQAPKGRN